MNRVEVIKKFCVTRIQDLAIDRVYLAHADLRVPPEVKREINNLIKAGGVPLSYSNHQSHADALAVAAVAKFLRSQNSGSVLQNLFGRRSNPDNPFRIKGLAVIQARSFEEGQQNQELKKLYDVFVKGAERCGVAPVSITRTKDVDLFQMQKSRMEARPLIEILRDGYGVMVFPEGTVQGGRHPKGAAINEIFGMQAVITSDLINLYQLMTRILGRNGRFPFVLPVATHGSFELLQSNEELVGLTEKGKASIRKSIILGSADLKVAVKILNPFTEEDISKDVGGDWQEYPMKFNTYVMSRLKAGLPQQAWGVY